MQWPAVLVGKKFLFGLLCLFESNIGGYRDEAVELAVDSFDSFETGPCQIERGELLASKAGGCFR